MDKRREYVTNLQSYTEGIDNEVTLILQSLQWDKNHLQQHPVMVSCAYDSNHKIPTDKIDDHESQCFFKHNGYTIDEHLLPDPPDTNSSTLVKLSTGDIAQIIGNASRSNPMFKKGVGRGGPEPMSLARLQAAYSADERRAIHDAVVSAVPSCHDLADLALPGIGDESKGCVILSRYEILAELRNMRRRRTKYRVAAKTRNYSDVLRDVIRTQMEHYNVVKTEPMDEISISGPSTTNTQPERDSVRSESYRNQPRIMPKPMVETAVKTEREDSRERNRGYNRDRSVREYKYEDRCRERPDVDRNTYEYDVRSRERRRDKDRETSRGQERLRKSDKDYEHEERSRGQRYDRYKDHRYDADYSSSSSRQHRDLGNRVKPGLEEYHDRNRDRRRRSEDGSYHTESYRDYEYEKRDRSRHRPSKDYEDQVKMEPGCDEPRHSTKENLRDARRGKNYEYNRERTDERFNVKQEREESATVEDDRSYENSNRKHIIDENAHKRKGQQGNGRHTKNPSGSSQHRERSDERYSAKQREEHSSIGPDNSVYEKPKDRHKNKDKLGKKYSEGRHYDEPDWSYRNREEFRESSESYIKQEEESPKSMNKSKKQKKSYKDNENLESDGLKKRTKKKGSKRDDYRKYDRSKDEYRREKRHNRDRSSGSESCKSSGTSEETDRPRGYKRYYDESTGAEYDPNKKVKVEK